jgi:hypothetical protein
MRKYLIGGEWFEKTAWCLAPGTQKKSVRYALMKVARGG